MREGFGVGGFNPAGGGELCDACLGMGGDAVDDVAVGRFGNWFLISNQSKMARQMADNLLDGKTGLTGNASFKRFKNASPSSDAWAFADLERLRKLNVAKELFSGVW